jgi:hypothetical protein
MPRPARFARQEAASGACDHKAAKGDDTLARSAAIGRTGEAGSFRPALARSQTFPRQ